MLMVRYHIKVLVVNNGICSCATLSSGENVCTKQMNCNYAASCGVNDACDNKK